MTKDTYRVGLVAVLALASVYLVVFVSARIERQTGIQGSLHTAVATSSPRDEDFSVHLTDDQEFITFYESRLPTYDEFLDNLEQACPYYKPDGVSYRDCISRVLNEAEQTVENIFKSIESDTRTVIAEINANDLTTFHTSEPEKSFLNSLEKLHKTWKPYRDALCLTDIAQSWGGSNANGFLVICQLYETDKYRVRLALYYHNWVVKTVAQFFDIFVEPNTDAFADLANMLSEYLPQR